MNRYYYPYCGWQLGFCKSEDGCHGFNNTCPYYIEFHPVHGDMPIMLGMETDLRDYALLGCIKEVLEESEC